MLLSFSRHLARPNLGRVIFPSSWLTLFSVLFSIGPADNYLPSAGATWYFQVFFCNMGESQMGKYGFAIWTPRMAASSLVFSTVVIDHGTWLDTAG